MGEGEEKCQVSISTFPTTYIIPSLYVVDDFFELSIGSETSLIVKAIQKNDFLSRLDDEQIAMMVDLLKVSHFNPGDEVIQEGSEGDSMYIVAGRHTP